VATGPSYFQTNAVGPAASATCANAVAAGSAASASGTNAVAVGTGASATGTNAVALGSGSVASSPNTVSVGSPGNERRVTNVAPATSLTDAVTLGQLQGVSTGIEQQIASLQTQIDDNRREARAGTTLALAASGLHYDPRPGKASLAGAFGNYKGLSGLAVGLGYALSDRWRFNTAVTATPQVSNYGLVAGASWTLN
jgi:trimeric autotransporter adhesin